MKWRIFLYVADGFGNNREREFVFVNGYIWGIGSFNEHWIRLFESMNGFRIQLISFMRVTIGSSVEYQL